MGSKRHKHDCTGNIANDPTQNQRGSIRFDGRGCKCLYLLFQYGNMRNIAYCNE